MFGTKTRWLLATGLIASATALSDRASAQDATGQKSPPAAAPTSPAGDDAVERARIHYERGLQLFNEENYDAALFEFERAYELAPTFKILYNMGRIQRQQNNYAAALRSYARYLSEGGDKVPPERRTEVEQEIQLLKPRTARVNVKVNVDGADVFADDIPACTATIESSCFGKSPLAAPIVVNPGRHKISAVKRGYTTATAIISVVGSDEVSTNLEMISLERPPEERPNPWVTPTILGWTGTGAAAIAAGILGVMSVNAQDDQDAKLKRPDVSRQELADARDKTQTLSGVSDALWITTAVFGGLSAYFTLRMLQHKGHDEPTPAAASRRVDFRAGPAGLGAVGTF
jgi:hypothetical protein